MEIWFLSLSKLRASLSRQTPDFDKLRRDLTLCLSENNKMADVLSKDMIWGHSMRYTEAAGNAILLAGNGNIQAVPYGPITPTEKCTKPLATIS